MDRSVTKGPLALRERDRGSGPLRSLARAQRQQATDAERLLWRHLRGRPLMGFKFRRQVVIEPYIVDFVCLDAKLMIEAPLTPTRSRRERELERWQPTNSAEEP